MKDPGMHLLLHRTFGKHNTSAATAVIMCPYNIGHMTNAGLSAVLSGRLSINRGTKWRVSKPSNGTSAFCVSIALE